MSDIELTEEDKKAKRKEYMKAYRKQNAERLKNYHKEYNKQYVIENAEKVKEYLRNYRKENVEKLKCYRKENAEAAREASKKYYMENTEKIREKQKCYNKQNIEKIREIQKRYFEKMATKNNLNLKQFKAALAGWSIAVRERDNYICCYCSSTENLHSHHILSKSKHPELALIISNGITLCQICHSEEHRINGML